MRHANFQTTMNMYTSAITTAKRDAQARAVDVLTDRAGAREQTRSRCVEPTYVRRISFVLSFIKVVDFMVGAAGFEPATSTV